MKPGKIFWGMFLLSIGVIILVRNIFHISVAESGLFKFWPVIFILFGIAYLTKQEKIRLGLFGIAGLTAALCIFSFKFAPFHWFSPEKGHRNYEGKIYESPYNPVIKRVSFELNGGGGNFVIDKIDSVQFRIIPQDTTTEFANSRIIEGDQMFLEVKNAADNIHIDSKDGLKYGFKVLLNPAPHYNFSLHTGAASNNFDLSAFLVDKLEMESGASSSVIKLGQPGEAESDVKISAGAASIELAIPKDVAARIRASTSLSTTSGFEQFTKIEDDLYQTDNYSSAEKKFSIEIEGGALTLSIQRY